MRIEYGDPGNPNQDLHGLNLSVRITRGKGVCTIDIADDQVEDGIKRIDLLILFLEWARHDFLFKDFDARNPSDSEIKAGLLTLKDRYRARYQQYLDETI